MKIISVVRTKMYKGPVVFCLKLTSRIVLGTRIKLKKTPQLR